MNKNTPPHNTLNIIALACRHNAGAGTRMYSHRAFLCACDNVSASQRPVSVIVQPI